MKSFGIAAAVALLCPSCPGAQEDPKKKDDGLVTPEARKGIEKGLEWLAKNQAKDGSYGDATCRVATSALAGLAFLADGPFAKDAKYAENLWALTRYLLKNIARTGYINEGNKLGDGGSGMHGHGMATLFLAELHAACGDLKDVPDEKLKAEVKDGLTHAVRLIERAQVKLGGWGYEPADGIEETSTSAAQVLALVAASRSGIEVDAKALEAARAYFLKLADENGRFCYSLTTRGGEGSITLTALGAAALVLLGEADDKKLAKALDRLPGARLAAHDNWFYYGGAHLALALAVRKDQKAWSATFPAMRDDLLKSQGSDGSWKAGGDAQTYGAAYGTAWALQTLLLPGRRLAIARPRKD